MAHKPGRYSAGSPESSALQEVAPSEAWALQVESSAVDSHTAVAPAQSHFAQPSERALMQEPEA